MTSKVPIEATMSAYGDLSTDRRSYRPLDRVVVQITGRYRGDQYCRIRVCDAQLQPYYEAKIELLDNRGEVSFHAAGALGVHWWRSCSTPLLSWLHSRNIQSLW